MSRDFKLSHLRGIPLKMAVTIQQLHQEVLEFALQPDHSLSRFTYPDGFEDRCRMYLDCSYGGDNPSVHPRFSVVNFDGFVSYNYLKGPEEQGYKDSRDYANLEDVSNWQTAIRCLGKYCLNLLLAPKRQDFYQIKVSFVYYI